MELYMKSIEADPNPNWYENEGVDLCFRFGKDDNYYEIRKPFADINDFNQQDDSIDEIMPMKRTCYYPFYNIMIDYNGDMLLCPHDWEKKLIVTNLAENNIIEIWNEKLLNLTRQRLSNKNRTFSPCNTCNVRGDVIAENSFNARQNYINH